MWSYTAGFSHCASITANCTVCPHTVDGVICELSVPMCARLHNNTHTHTHTLLLKYSASYSWSIVIVTGNRDMAGGGLTDAIVQCFDWVPVEVEASLTNYIVYLMRMYLTTQPCPPYCVALWGQSCSLTRAARQRVDFGHQQQQRESEYCCVCVHNHRFTLKDSTSLKDIGRKRFLIRSRSAMRYD